MDETFVMSVHTNAALEIPGYKEVQFPLNNRKENFLETTRSRVI